MALVNYLYPSSRRLVEINPEKVGRLQADRPTFPLFPDENDDLAWYLEWFQKDNMRGFQQLRGINGQPSYVKMVGLKFFHAEPGVFGEYMYIDERMMTQRARFAAGVGATAAGLSTEGPRVQITDLVTERQEYLNLRETDLKEFVHWAILLNGTITILGSTGAQFVATFPVQTATMTDWSVLNTATPYRDLLNLGTGTLVRGRSLSFGRNAVARMNSLTASYLLLNTNANDIGGKFVTTGGIGIRVGAPATIADVNTIFQSGALPRVETYDEGYFRESDGAFQIWIPDDKVSIVGQRTDGSQLGAYRHVTNVNNDNAAAGRYTRVIDTLARTIPRKISVHQGHNGGPVLYYPSAILKANV